jgi:acyl-CoA synthetase (NDP forming)
MTVVAPMLHGSSRLKRMLRPRSIAVFGGHAAAEIVRQSEKIGYTGEIWPVHPRHATVAGRRAYRCAADLPDAPDAAFLGVNRHASIALMTEMSQMGAGGAVAYASGYAEAGQEGLTLQSALITAAAGMPFFGPNCYGFINYFDRCLVWPDQFGGQPVTAGVAIITQSGNIGLNVTMQRRALPIGYLITLGNQAGAGPEDAMQAVLEDPRVTAIGLHLEGIADPAAFAAVVARAHARGIGVVMLKTGSSAAGARIAQSHTASMASADAVVSAYCRQIGVARVASIPVLLEALKILHFQGPLAGRSLASLSCSGGEAALIADMAAGTGLHFVALSPAAETDIAATLPELVSVSNPLDYHTFGWRNRGALAATFAAMLRAAADLTILILDFPRNDTCDTADWDIAADALADAAAATSGRAAILATLPEAMPETQACRLAALGIVPLFGMHDALQAIMACADIGQGAAGTFCATQAPAEPAVALAEWEGKRVLSKFGVVSAEGIVAHTVQDAVAAAIEIGFPVALKASGRALAHKTELGGVMLGLADAGALGTGAATLLKITGEIYIERMIGGAVAELIVGVSRDASFGLYFVIGSGGILAELVADSVMLLIPATRADIEAGLAQLRVMRLMEGYRGGRRGDIAACCDAILAIQHFAMANAAHLHELDVNPLMVCEAGKGAVAADVFLRLADGGLING